VSVDWLTGRSAPAPARSADLTLRRHHPGSRYHAATEAWRALGQLDEEFVGARVGDSFSLGVQSWRIQRITHNDVLVAPVDSRSSMAPFWRAEERDRSHFLSDLIGRFLERLLPRVDDPELASELEQRHRLQPAAAAELCRLLQAQVAATGTLPTASSRRRAHHRA
jgi:Lhr-like helicase